MPELFSNTDDGRVLTANVVGFSNARDADTGATVTTGEVSSTNFTAVNKFSSPLIRKNDHPAYFIYIGFHQISIIGH